jgi:RNA polymerase primary sigma factor
MRQLKISQQTTNRTTIAVEKYLNDVSKIPLLTPAEETELAMLIFETGDEKAKKRLIDANLRFVISVAKQYQGSGLPLEDLISEGNLGLMKAADRFDPTKGFKFISFAVWWIRQMILQAISTTGRTIYQPSNRTGKFGKLRRAVAELEQRLERQPVEEEIAEYMGMKVEEVKDILETQAQTTSYNAPIKTDGTPSEMVSLYEDESSIKPDESVSLNDDRATLMKHMSKYLTERQLQAICSYYGINSKQKSLVEIADDYGITREGARQIIEAGTKRLKNRKDLLKELFYVI